jgi:hypothetical protein
MEDRSSSQITPIAASGKINPLPQLFRKHPMPSQKQPGPDAKQDVSVLANHLRRPRIIQGFTNDNTNSQFSLSTKNPDDRENLFRIHNPENQNKKQPWRRPCDKKHDYEENTPALSFSLPA